MEIRHLRTFLRVATLGSFTQAARELGYSQANVSAQIQQLETELGTPLFDRLGRTIALTSFGEALLPKALELCALAEDVENLNKSDASIGGKIHMGLTDSISELFLEEAFIAFHRRFPRVELEISLDTTLGLLDRLQKGQLDGACLISDPLPKDRWQVLHAITVPIVIAANPGLAITKKKRPTLADVAAESPVLMETTAPYSLQYYRALAEQRLESKAPLRVESAAMACRLVEQEPMVTVLPLYTVKAAAEKNRITILPVSGWHQTQVVQGVLHRTKVPTPQIRGFLEAVFAELSPKIAADLP